ncbi:MAG: YggS family pyridoxal phosphate-dependent enzyme, partial [Candidatus Binataceae bacterium]
VLASKTQPPEAVRAAYLAGARQFGENYVQEAATKREKLLDLTGVQWRLIGHLQKNKAKVAARLFDVVETIDSEGLAAALARDHPSPPFPVLIEINLAAESAKSGVAPRGAEGLINAIREKVAIQGLMAIPPASGTAEASRPYFAKLRQLRDQLAKATGLALSDLSMGMTGDFEVAISEGATIVRVGRAIFGERT